MLSILEDREGHLWFGTGELGTEEGGVSRYDGQTFTTFTTQDGLAQNTVRSILEDRDGHLWFGTGGGGVSRYDGTQFTTFTTQDGLAQNTVWSILEDQEGNLWFGTGELGTEGGGVSRYDGQTFTTFTTQDGLAQNTVRSILEDRAGHLWFGTFGGGVSRYDGLVFQSLLKRDGLVHNTVHETLQDRNGDIWIATEGGITRYRPGHTPPVIRLKGVIADRRYGPVQEIHLSSSQKFIIFEFQGRSFTTRPDGMAYVYRLKNYDTGWQTTYTRRVEYQDLPIGNYTFEVQAVDRDLVYSETPATVALAVHLPYERIGWFSALGIAILLIIWQAVRIVQRDRRLQEANTALSSGNKELFQANQALRQDRAVERIRGEVQAMEQASDFEKVLSLLSEDLKTVGLSFHTCGIDVLDEPVDDPTMAHFEDHGFQYTTYTLDPEGQVLQKSYTLTAPFPEVIGETLERFIAGESWQGTSSGTAIVEVSIARYGRLRLTDSDRQGFTESEIGTLQDFAIAIALGYTRYLDFVNLETANREIRAQTERKSAFLASMSHELRTPMNAIIGFTRMVLRRSGGVLPEQQKDNLNKVTESANRLLNLINDLMDLSKIEAGRMDVEAGPFSVKQLILSCCGTVEPLVNPGVDLKYEVPDEVGEACTDEDKLRHVIGNLLSNAVKFTDEGEIVIRARTVHDQLLISATDTGIGMPAEALETIFDEFQQVKDSDKKHKGTGLGLAITRRYTELLGGTLSVESEMGKGSVFTVQVPLVYSLTGTD